VPDFFCPNVTKFRVPRQILIKVFNQISRKSVGSRAETCELTEERYDVKYWALFANMRTRLHKLMHEFVPLQARRVSGNTTVEIYHAMPTAPAQVHVVNICVHNRAIYFSVSCWAAQSLKNRDLFIAVLWAGKSVQITGPQQRVIFVNYRIMDYYLIHPELVCTARISRHAHAFNFRLFL
jgi:hypothetical protein